MKIPTEEVSALREKANGAKSVKEMLILFASLMGTPIWEGGDTWDGILWMEGVGRKDPLWHWTNDLHAEALRTITPGKVFIFDAAGKKISVRFVPRLDDADPNHLDRLVFEEVAFFK